MSLQGRVGRRGACLIFFGFLSLIVGLGSIGRPANDIGQANAHVITDILPLPVFYTIWTITGVICFFGALFNRAEVFAFGLFTGLCWVFGLGYFAAVIDPIPGQFRPWLAGALFFGFGVLSVIIAGWKEPK